MINTQDQLQTLFRDNFVAAFRAQVAHVNIVGRNFHSDHELLGKIYEHLQDNIDVIAELIRTVGEFMPTNLQGIIVDSRIDDDPVIGTSQDFLETVRDNLLQLVDSYKILAEAASDEDVEEIENYAQEEILVLNKYLWQLDATLSPEQ